MSTAQAAASGTGALDGQPGAVIHTEELTKVYPGTDFAAVDHLNLDVRAGEIFGLPGRLRLIPPRFAVPVARPWL